MSAAPVRTRSEVIEDIANRLIYMVERTIRRSTHPQPNPVGLFAIFVCYCFPVPMEIEPVRGPRPESSGLRA